MHTKQKWLYQFAQVTPKTTLLGILFILFGLSLFTIMLELPYYDDVEFLNVEKGIETYGKPFVYYGENHEHWSWIFNATSEHYYLYSIHPPLYPYMLYFFMVLFGNSYVVARIFGLLGLGIVILIFWYSIKQNASDTHQAKSIFSFFILLIISSPIIIQNATLVTIDTALLPIFLVGFILHFNKNYKNFNLNNMIVSSLILAGALFSKLTTPPIVLFALALTLLLSKEFKLFFKFVSVVVLASSLFLFAWGSYMHFIGNPMYELFRQLFVTRVATTPDVIRNILSLSYELFLVSPSIMVLGILAWYSHIVEDFKKNKLPIIPAVFVLTYMIYAIKAPAIYYRFFLFQIFFSMIAGYIHNKVKINFRYILGILLFSLYFYLLPNPIASLTRILPLNQQSYYLAFYLFLGLLPLFLTLLMAVTSTIYKNQFISCLLMLGLASNLALNLTYLATDTLYGDTGFEEAVTFIKSNTNESDFIISYKDMAYNTNRKFFWVDSITKRSFNGRVNNINNNYILANNSIKYIIYPAYFNEVSRGFSDIDLVNINFKEVKRFGDYIIYERVKK